MNYLFIIKSLDIYSVNLNVYKYIIIIHIIFSTTYENINFYTN